MDERQRKPLISTECENEEPSAPKSRGGCLSNLLGIIGFIFIILILLRSCGGDRDSEKTPKDSTPQPEETEIISPTDTPAETADYDVTIVLAYEEVPLTTNSPINVCIDDLVIGRQDAGTEESYIVTLDEGEHKFYLKNDGLYSTSELSFTVSSQQTSFQFGAKTRLTVGVEVWEGSVDNDQAISTSEENAQGANYIGENKIDYVGTWEDIGGQSCILEIEPLAVDGYYSIHINWWAGTQYNIDWSYSGRFDGTMGGIECDHGTRTDYSPGASSEEVYSDSGTGWLRLTSDGRLAWENSSENLSEAFPDMTFLFQKSNT